MNTRDRNDDAEWAWRDDWDGKAIARVQEYDGEDDTDECD